MSVYEAYCSSTYKDHFAGITEDQREFVKATYAMCEKHYDAGGDLVVECLTPQEIVGQFNSLDDVKEYIGLRLDRAADCRWGEDDDPEITRLEEFKKWK